MKQPHRLQGLLAAGFVLITIGLAASSGFRPAEVLMPLAAVVAGLTALTAASGGGPRAFL